MIDQRLLPGEFKLLVVEQYQQVVDAIRDMAIRGAPAIGAAAGFGLALAAARSDAVERDGRDQLSFDAACVLRRRTSGPPYTDCLRDPI